MTQKDGGWLAAGQAFKNGCGAVGAVCSVVSKVTGVDCRGSGGVWIRGGGAAEAQRGVTERWLGRG